MLQAFVKMKKYTVNYISGLPPSCKKMFKNIKKLRLTLRFDLYVLRIVYHYEMSIYGPFKCPIASNWEMQDRCQLLPTRESNPSG